MGAGAFILSGPALTETLAHCEDLPRRAGTARGQTGLETRSPISSRDTARWRSHSDRVWSGDCVRSRNGKSMTAIPAAQVCRIEIDRAF